MPKKWLPLNCFLIVLAKRNQQDLVIFLDCSRNLVGSSHIQRALVEYFIVKYQVVDFISVRGYANYATGTVILISVSWAFTELDNKLYKGYIIGDIQ